MHQLRYTIIIEDGVYKTTMLHDGELAPRDLDFAALTAVVPDINAAFLADSEAHKAAKAKAEAEHASALSELQQEHTTAIADLTREHETTVANLTQEKQQADAEHAAALAKLTTEHQQAETVRDAALAELTGVRALAAKICASAVAAVNNESLTQEQVRATIIALCGEATKPAKQRELDALATQEAEIAAKKKALEEELSKQD